MKPPYSLSQEILILCNKINKLLGNYEGLKLPKPEPQLRRKNRIKSIQGSLAIEGNTLSVDQITALFENKRVLGPKKEILEVKNAISVYDKVKKYKTHSEKSFLKAHHELMQGLVSDAGQWRAKDVGVVQNDKVLHMGPKATRVPQLMSKLFAYLKSEKKTNYLITSSVMHYEIEFIHPFSDGNGRMGRLWQYTILAQNHPFFEFTPMESVIREHQKQYYKSLQISDHKGDSTPFIEFCLKAILESMNNLFEEMKPKSLTPESRLELAKTYFKKKSFSRKDYLSYFKTVSTATASRDFRYGVEIKILKKQGDKALTKYIFL